MRSQFNISTRDPKVGIPKLLGSLKTGGGLTGTAEKVYAPASGINALVKQIFIVNFHLATNYTFSLYHSEDTAYGTDDLLIYKETIDSSKHLQLDVYIPLVSTDSSIAIKVDSTATVMRIVLYGDEIQTRIG